MSSEPSGFGASPRTEEHHQLRCLFREAHADESEDVIPSLIRPDRHPEPLIPDAPLHYENTD